MAGCGSYSKVEGFAFLPITCFAMALTTFISQNLGAKEYQRAQKGAVFGVICSLSIAELIGVVIYFFAPQFLAAFNDTPQVIAYGTDQARIDALFYFLLAFSHCMAGILRAGILRGAGKSTVPMFVMLICWCIIRVSYITAAVHFIPDIHVIFWAYPRGAGKSTVPMFVMLICWCIIRVSYITAAVHFIPDIHVIFWAYPLTWTLSSITFLIYFLKSDWIHGLEKQRIN